MQPRSTAQADKQRTRGVREAGPTHGCGRGPEIRRKGNRGHRWWTKAPCICTTGLGQRVRAVSTLMGCARSERPRRHRCRSDETRTADERDPLEASVRRGWRESSKRSSASVGADAPFRGKGIARPERPREPKQSWRARARHARMWAITTGQRVCRLTHPERARSRSCVGTDRTDGRRDPDHRAVACPAERSSQRSGHTRCSVSSRPAAPSSLAGVAAHQGERKPPSADRAVDRRLLDCTSTGSLVDDIETAPLVLAKHWHRC
jgi:hypothetical protein